MSRWWTSDQHFGHANIIRYCDRPFADVDEMNEAMVDRWNEVVGADDEVWVVGDVVMGDLPSNLRAWVAPLRGRKVLVPGNHDRCWTGRSKGAKSRSLYFDLGGFERIVDSPERVQIGKYSVLVDHFPYVHDSPYDVKYEKYRPVDNGSWLLHGHIHEKWRQRGRQINIGVDAWDFAPVSEDALVDLIAQGPADREPLPAAGSARALQPA